MSIPTPAFAPLFSRIRADVRARFAADPAGSLDRALFAGSLSLAAVQVADRRSIAAVRKTLDKANVLFPSPLPDLSVKLLQDGPEATVENEIRRTTSPMSVAERPKCLLLRPDISLDRASHPDALTALLASSAAVKVVPLTVPVDYSNWSYLAVLTAFIADDDVSGEVPTGFSIVGHVAHLNLRDQFLRYKRAIAEAVIDKNPIVRTVINKIDSVGASDEFRTFAYELLAGDPSTEVEVVEQNCIFRFDYADVYWNSRLSTEHTRIVGRLRPGEAVCDVMAGVGPFSVPAGRKGVFCRANDLNPHSFAGLVRAVSRNKVAKYVTATNSDGACFIRDAVVDLMAAPRSVDVFDKIKYIQHPDSGKRVPAPPVRIRTDVEPRLFSHFIMNLPASAIEFLPKFIGLYASSAGRTLQMDPAELQKARMPLIHVYTFGLKAADNGPVAVELCSRASDLLGSPIRLRRLALSSDPADSASWDALEDGEAEVQDVRDVAPKKRMFCLTLRLPREVAFRPVQ